MSYLAAQFDVAVIGAGHAGCEAALAAARLGARTVCFAVNLDAVGNMPCNPSIGGAGKGQLVRELAALGGEMPKIADFAALQYRTLGLGKGPAVRSTRAQADRMAYRQRMKQILESQENLHLIQAEVVELRTDDTGAVSNLVTDTGAIYKVRACVIATGTFLGGRTICGDVIRQSGPDGLAAATRLTESLTALGLPIRRFKTGTPPRVLGRTIDFHILEEQPSDPTVRPFSGPFAAPSLSPNRPSAPCFLTYTTPQTHRIIRENLHRSPLFSGVIEGIGPRYCPSIEDKIVRFADKERHQLFLEPMGENTDEWYIQGLSSSLPEEVQQKIVHSIPGLEHAHITRRAYAIEYDCIDPTALLPSLECKKVPNLYGSGQFNGTSGYEEAAVQGFLAGVNAARKLLGQDPVVLNRWDGYIGVLVDDLVTKGTNEPYRMMTSRTEYRLTCREDNADLRLAQIGHEIGLVSQETLTKVQEKYAAVSAEIARLEKRGLAAVLRRPEVGYFDLNDPSRPDLPPEVVEQVEILVKYEGYIQRQERQLADLRRMESHELPPDMDYSGIDGLRLEARQKLAAIKPRNLGQAGRISGVSPADLTALMFFLEKNRHES